jgi:hypothetical protein
MGSKKFIASPSPLRFDRILSGFAADVDPTIVGSTTKPSKNC